MIAQRSAIDNARRVRRSANDNIVEAVAIHVGDFKIIRVDPCRQGYKFRCGADRSEQDVDIGRIGERDVCLAVIVEIASVNREGRPVKIVQLLKDAAEGSKEKADVKDGLMRCGEVGETVAVQISNRHVVCIRIIVISRRKASSLPRSNAFRRGKLPGSRPGILVNKNVAGLSFNCGNVDVAVIVDIADIRALRIENVKQDGRRRQSNSLLPIKLAQPAIRLFNEQCSVRLGQKLLQFGWLPALAVRGRGAVVDENLAIDLRCSRTAAMPGNCQPR